MFSPVQSRGLAIGTSQNPSLAFLNPVQQGNSIILAISWGAATGVINSVTDSLNVGINYSQVVLLQAQGKTSGIYYLKQSLAGPLAITAALSVSEAFNAFSIYEFAGISVPDVTASNSGTATTTPNVSLTTTMPNELLFALREGAGAITALAPGWTGIISQHGSEWIISGPPGLYTASWTTASGVFDTVMASFIIPPDSMQNIQNPSSALTTNSLKAQYRFA